MNRPASPVEPAPSSSASRYEMLATIASGGMATVYVGRTRGAGGFSRMVAVKRAHPHLLQDPTYRAMLVDEARLAARLHHPNVVAVLDVEELEGELSLVMDYVEGASLYDLIEASHAAGRPLPPRIAMRVALDACAGLQAAHALTDEYGQPLGLVHRDVSPQNILVGIDGVARLSDFGIAKHAEGAATATGVLKGKLSYMAPEYLESTALDARSDVFSLGVVVWEALAGQKLFRGKSELETFKKVLATVVPPLSSVAGWANERLDTILYGALARDPEQRFQTAEDFGVALENEARYDDLIATPAEVGGCVRELFGDALAERRAEVRRRSAQAQIERPPVSQTSIARREAATAVAPPPTPVPSEPSPEVSGLQRRAQRITPEPPSQPAAVAPAYYPETTKPSAQAPMPSVTIGDTPMAPAAPEPELPIAVEPEPQSPASSGALWKGAIVLAVLAIVGSAIAFIRMQSGEARSSSPASARVVAPPAPTAVAADPTPKPPPRPTPTSIAVGDLPEAKPVPIGSGRWPGGRPPTKGHAPEPASYSTGIPLSAWPPAPPPPAPSPSTAPSPPAPPPPAPEGPPDPSNPGF